MAFFLGQKTDALIILSIISLGAILGFIQERGAANALKRLLKMVQVKAEVLRDGKIQEIPVESIVPGDIVQLNAGDIIPADCYILESQALFIDESALTGESFGVEKKEGASDKKINALFMGTHVISGTGLVVAVLTDKKTEFGKIAAHLQTTPPKTTFERNIRDFGLFLFGITVILVISIFVINTLFKRPLIESLLFSLALGVGFTPQLLPAIITINLSKGAKHLAKKKVIVKRLESIENFGSMDILCVDKTGSITQGEVGLSNSYDFQEKPSNKLLLYGYLNAHLQVGYTNPLDKAITKTEIKESAGWKRTAELPFDFEKRRITLTVQKEGESLLISKGATASVLPLCTQAEDHEGKIVPIAQVKEQIQKLFEEKSSQGFRLLAVAYKKLGTQEEKELIFLGFFEFNDPLKPEIKETLEKLKHLGIGLKIITGDNKLIALHVGRELGLSKEQVLTGTEMDSLSQEELEKIVLTKEIFAEIHPNQKEKIVVSLKKAGHTIGFLGDGINDISGLHTADVGISVDNATDAAKESADIILLKKDLNVLIEGVKEGRRTFGNSLKYIFMATSANFGNMFSMAGASLFLSFLPMLPRQILLTNFLTDLPEMTISTDRVDAELLKKPRELDIKFIRKFMITFGLISSFYDYLTFALLLFFASTQEQFRTGWFVESVLSASLIILFIRTRKPFYQSKPSIALTASVAAVVIITLILPYTPVAVLFGFTPLPPIFILLIGVILTLYATSVEVGKRIFYSFLGKQN